MSFLFAQAAAVKPEVKAPPPVEKPVVVLTAAQDQMLDDIKTTTVLLPVSAAAKRLLGKKTSSMSKKTMKGDGLVFSVDAPPPSIHRPVGNANMIFTITQEVLNRSAFTTSNAVSTFYAVSFAVALLDQISSLTAVFDQYRISLVEVWLVPQLGPIQTPGNTIVSVIDYDDDTALGTFNAALDYINCVTSNGSLAHYRKFVPHAAVALYSGAFTSFGNVASPWCDAASTGIKHYGLKVNSTLGSAAITYDLTTRLTIQWRNVR